MRVPTFQQYQQPVLMMQQQSSNMQKTQMQLTAGLRILKPSDDPGGAAKVLNLTANIGQMEQYDRNSTAAKDTLSQQDAVMGDVNDVLQRVRELALQGMSPTNHDSARADIATELDQRLQELLSLANSRDANGEYLFSGGMGSTKPFLDQNGSVSYQGDQTGREIQIGDGSRITTRDAGDKVFMEIPGGDGIVNVKAAAANRGNLLVGQFSGNQNFVSDTYSVTFSAGTGGSYNYTVTDSATPTPNVVSTGTYQEGGNVSFGGVQMTLSGTPVVGDVVTVQPSQSQSLFAMVKSMITSLRTPSAGNNSSVMQNQMAQGLGNLDQALNVINDQRAAVGARLNSIDNVDDINADFKLQLDTLKSSTQDLDYADALTRFNQQLAALQAAQETYKKTSQLSLFNYI